MAVCWLPHLWVQRWCFNETELPTLFGTWMKYPSPAAPWGILYDPCPLGELRLPRWQVDLIWSHGIWLESFSRRIQALIFRLRGQGYGDWLVMSATGVGEGWEGTDAMPLPSLTKRRSFTPGPRRRWACGSLLRMLPFWQAAETWTAVCPPGRVSGFWLFVFQQEVSDGGLLHICREFPAELGCVK